MKKFKASRLPRLPQLSPMQRAGSSETEEPFLPPEKNGAQPNPPIRVGIAFQGGCFLAGAVHTGVVQALIDLRVFDSKFQKCRARELDVQLPDYQLCAFSGTSAGALVAAVCWEAALKRDFAKAKEVLKGLWFHWAIGTIPTPFCGDFWKNFDRAARRIELYDLMSQSFRVPWIQGLFEDWITQYLHPLQAIQRLDQRRRDPSCPHLALGAADIAEGEIGPFCDKDFLAELDCIRGDSHTRNRRAYTKTAQFMLAALMASGSLDEMNGVAKIRGTTRQGAYLDGAWGENPPIECMLDFKVDEIWFVEIFAQRRTRLPCNHQEREDRKEELAQNAMVEQQFEMIRKVNSWRKQRKVDPDQFRHIEIRKLSMELEFTPGARLVNNPSYLQEMVDYGYKSTLHFVSTLETPVPAPVPAH